MAVASALADRVLQEAALGSEVPSSQNAGRLLARRHGLFHSPGSRALYQLAKVWALGRGRLWPLPGGHSGPTGWGGTYLAVPECADGWVEIVLALSASEVYLCRTWQARADPTPKCSCHGAPVRHENSGNSRRNRPERP